MLFRSLARVELPFERVVEAVRPVRSTSATPLVQAAIAWDTARHGARELSGVAVDAVPLTFARARFDLKLVLTDEGEAVRGAIEYATALFDRATIERHAHYLVRVLTQMTETPEQETVEIELMHAE